jgi:hypothetical protein
MRLWAKLTGPQARRRRHYATPSTGRTQAHDDHAAPAAKAEFAMAPALVQAIDPASLRTLNKPVSIVAGSGRSRKPTA